MPSQFFKLSKRLLKACPADWILTPNERLAREFIRTYDAWQLEQGRTAWATPLVSSFNRFVTVRAQERLPFSDRGQLLSPEAELLLWQESGERNSDSLTGLAAEAWRLLHAYRIGLDDEGFGGTVNSRTFRRWARRFRERLKQDGLVTHAELADLLPGTSERLHLLAFDVITPQIADWIRRTERAGGTVRQHRPGAMRNGPQKRVAAADRAAEIHMAAQWARHVLTRYPSARIGVVFPYLTDAYFAIANAFEVEFADAPDGFNLSGGIPLDEQPCWRDAELLLRLSVGEIGHGDLGRLQRSQWLDLGLAPATLRNSAETLRLQDLAGAGGALGRLASRVRSLPSRQSFGRWVGVFRSLLTLGGWNGSQAASRQYQAFLQLTDCLERYSAIPLLPNLTGAEALQTLGRLLASRLFAAERPPAPVQVLGYLETAGLVFTHLWVAGLQDTAWPAAPTPNPLLPIPLQRLRGVPRSDHAMEMTFATEQMQRWRRASRYMVLSHAVEDGEETHQCSSLTASIPPVAIEKLVSSFRSRRHPWLSERPAARLDPVTGNRGSPVPGTVTRGGTSLLRDQAQCPFRAWAIHRLGLNEVREPENYPDALERGTLIHDALFALYEDAEGPPTDTGIDRAVTRALRRNLKQAPEMYRQNERVRLKSLLEAWVEFDAQRPDFTVVGLEEAIGFSMPRLELSLRIDRIDRDARTGAKVVIDYKTGQVTASRLLAERLIEPQLPMYALSDAGIRAVLYAQVGTDRIALKGLASEGIEFGRARVKKLSASEWRDLTARWKIQIESLAREFHAGHAAVAPSSPGICNNCHLPAFCRVNAGAAAALSRASTGQGGK